MFLPARTALLALIGFIRRILDLLFRRVGDLLRAVFRRRLLSLLGHGPGRYCAIPSMIYPCCLMPERSEIIE
jgi:hypothetical protein